MVRIMEKEKTLEELMIAALKAPIVIREIRTKEEAEEFIEAVSKAWPRATATFMRSSED